MTDGIDQVLSSSVRQQNCGMWLWFAEAAIAVIMDYRGKNYNK